jgi:Iap family predicted aminopeptidase
MTHPARESIDQVRASQAEAAAKLDQERQEANQIVQLELSTLEKFSSLTEAIEEAKERCELAIARMDAAAKPYSPHDAARNIFNNTEQLPVIIGKLANADCLAKRRPGLLMEIKRLSIDAAQERLEAFQNENVSVLRKHGLIA